MSEEEAIKHIKELLEFNKEQLKLGEEFEDYPVPVNEGIDLVNKYINTYETVLSIIEKQKEKEINLKKELMKQDELIEKLSRELNEKTKRKIYIRRAKNEI